MEAKVKAIEEAFDKAMKYQLVIQTGNESRSWPHVCVCIDINVHT